MIKEYTMKDVAELAGVSLSTVSRVLSDSANVSREKKIKVLKVVEKLNYNPNALARSLAKNSSKTIGVIIPDLANPFFPEILRGIDDIVSVNGYSIILCNTNYRKEKEENYINEIIEKRAEGLVIVSTHVDNRQLIENIKNRINIVAIQTTIAGVDCIDTTNEKGAFEATEYLISNGHKKIGFIGWQYKVTAISERLKGFRQALKKHNIEIDDEYIIECGVTQEEACVATLKLIEKKEVPTAIMAVNDNTAIGAMMAIQQKGLKIPEDISIIGFDNIVTSKLVYPKLTTVAQPIYLMGETAGELLIRNIEKGRSEFEKKISLPTKLIIRDSVKKVVR